ncbi:MAG: MATE family efflux transporter [Flavobacteriaceae bacterium]|nr:MATE family efflux transporter [Flavobacteriaceae bacterium]
MPLERYTREFRYNLRLAGPVILGMLGHTLVAFVDNIMVGQLGTAELAAVSLGNSFMFVAMSLGIGFSTAITPLVAEAEGEGNFSRGKIAFKHGLVLCTLLGLLLFTSVFFAKPLMHLMKQPDEVVALAMPYLTYVAISLVPLIIFQAFKQCSDGLSLTRYPMYATLVANVVNVLLNYCFIFGHFGAPALGVVGAAIGTLASRVIMIWVLWWFLAHHKKAKWYVRHLRFRILSTKVFKKILGLGFPSAMQMFFEVVFFTGAIWLSGVLGKNPQAANQIALNLSSMTFMVAMGFSVVAMIRVGNQKGKGAFSELRRIAFSIFLLALICSVLFAVVFLTFNHWLPTMYLDMSNLEQLSDNNQVLEMAKTLILIAALYQISDAIQVVALGALRGLQDVFYPTLYTFFAYWVVGFPISIYLGMYTDLGITGIWIGLLAGLVMAALTLLWRFHKLSRRFIESASGALS